MALAIQQAQRAADEGEVPVGAVVVLDGVVIGSGHNQVIQSNDPSAHAEVMAMRAAGNCIANYRLLRSTIYITLEPCVMCAGAILHARIAQVVFGAYDARWGAAGSVADVLDSPLLNYACESIGGVQQADCASLLTQFFKNKR